FYFFILYRSPTLATYTFPYTTLFRSLIVQGDCDEYLPLHQSQRLFEALQVPKGLHILPGADHTFTRGEDFRMMTTLLADWIARRSEEHTSELQSRVDLVCRLLLETQK